jgi:hypothetical protein
MVLRVYLVPYLGHKRLDAISNEDVQWLKGSLETKAVKTVNNILTVLSVFLKKAVEWNVIDRLPCAIRLLKTRSVFERYNIVTSATSAKIGDRGRKSEIRKSLCDNS